MHWSCFSNGRFLNTSVLLFDLQGRKIPRKLRFIVPLTCVYPVQTPFLLSQISIGPFDVSTSNISFLWGASHRKREVTACRSSQPITGHRKRPTIATAIWRHKQHGCYVTTVTGTNNKMAVT